MANTTDTEQQETHISGQLDAFSHDSATTPSLADPKDLLRRIKGYLRETTKVNSVTRGLENCLDDDVYLISESEVPGLLCHLSDPAEQLRKQVHVVAFSDSPGSSSKPPSRVLRPLRSVPATAADPATTIASSQAVMTKGAGDPDEEEIAKKTSATKATIVSRNSVTEITWHPSPGNLQGKDVTTTEGCRSIGEMARTLWDGHTELVNGYDDRREAEGTKRRPSVLARVHQKSVQFGQVVSSYLNGAYLNTDYRPRRPSNIVRMKAMLDRKPPRAKEDAAIFSALTGAKPLQHDD
ncbi:hypothetical protein M406DRAFT_333347 [Cryphonectria parasitica EP155]|uniref:Uncharacterized protein n=1 Tax=Cryphonectria parasitica (strain ATCC 38755 / EP155) TaxID=660469 RepID=A0A9P5CKS4_CRYP1|nr:uncharacterized protein M406DRAFT_333347 [Cryphonectria parasitica EP155]KAF3761271.1 hypothetical protein M406DRAFT_333347 [Cryphonectria parasitica EP155]